MYSNNKGNIGVELIKYFISELRKIDNIKVFEKSVVIPKKTKNEIQLIIRNNDGTYKDLISENIILAIGGDLGSGLYGPTSNLTYQSYQLHKALYNNLQKKFSIYLLIFLS